MKKGILWLLAGILALTLAALPFLCVHCDLLPEKATEYYAKKAEQDALSGTGAEAELMRLLLGSATPAAASAAPALTFSLYGLALACSAALGCLAVFLLDRGKKERLPGLFIAAALAPLLGLLGARLLYCAVDLGFYWHEVEAPVAMAYLWEGGLSLMGALGGAALAGLIAARISKLSSREALDAMAPGLLLFCAGASLGQWLLGAGYGPETAFSLPGLTVMIHDLPRLNTALLRALCAVVLLAVSQKKKLGFPLTAFLYGGLQLLLESLRRDGHMLWGFVHAEQAMALVIALSALLYLARGGRRALCALLSTLVLAGAIVALEFALDRSNLADGILYAGYILALSGYLALGVTFAKKNIRTDRHDAAC